jgi:glycosyltransferase involved in cell wall biosynthesis
MRDRVASAFRRNERRERDRVASAFRRKSNMTVLHVGAGNGYGGIERMLVTLAATPHPRLTQQFVVAFPGRLERELAAAGATVYRLPSPRASRPLLIWRGRREFRAVLDRVAPEVVIFHGAWPHAMFAAAARPTGVRIGFWQHQPIARPAWPDRWARRVRPDFVVFNSAFTQARPAFVNLPGQVIHPPVESPDPLPASDRRALRAALGAADDDFVVLMAARLERWKGHAVLIEAARRLPAASVRVWIAGAAQRPSEAAYEQRLRALAATPELAGVVTLLGEREDVATLMRLADAYCQPNLRGEPYGIAIAEAMRAGLPCVVSAAGGAAELLDESCGMHAAPGDTAAIAAALQALQEDPARRAEMGRAAMARAARLTDPVGRLDELESAMAAHSA